MVLPQPRRRAGDAVSERAFLNRLAVTPGKRSLAQAELADRMRLRLAAVPGADSIRQMIGFVYGHSGIERRHLEATPEEIAARGWYVAVNEATLAMGRRTLESLFSGGATAGSCDGFIAVSASFAGFPSLTRRLQEAMGFPLDALCYDLTGLGCAGPTHGLELAHILVTTGVCRAVCLLCVDAMGTHGESRCHRTAPTMSQLVAHCLASDGAAAALISREPGDGAVLSWRACRLRSRLWPDALGENDFTASEDGQPFMSVGKAIRTRLTDELEPLLDEIAAEPALFHPGGAALVRALAAARPELGESLELSSAVLRQSGNIGSASLLWVLERALRQRRSLSPRLRLVALGPGIVSTVLRLDGVEATS